MLKILFLLVLFSPDGSGYREFVGEAPDMTQCEQLVQRVHEKYKGTEQLYAVACLPILGGVEI